MLGLYIWKIKKCTTITNAFQKILDKSGHKPNKIWVNKDRKFYNNSMKSWLQDNDIEMFSTHNGGKSVVAARFIWTVKNKMYQYMTSISKNVYINKLDDIVHKYNNTYHSTMIMKPFDVNLSIYFANNILTSIKRIIKNILNFTLVIM